MENKTKSVVDRINDIIIDTFKDLKDGKYKLRKIGEHTSFLEYGENVLEVWKTSKSSCCIYSKVGCMDFPKFNDDELRETVFKIATTETEYSLQAELDVAERAYNSAEIVMKSKKESVDRIQKRLDFLKSNQIKD